MKNRMLLLLVLLICVTSVSAYEVEYYHSDNLGSPVVVTDSNKRVVWSSDYESFGSTRNEQGVNDLKYNQKELDDTGLYYYGARYYDSSVGRFVTVDSRAGELADSQSQNRYIYVKNNPLKYIDPTGNQHVDSRHKELKGKSLKGSNMNSAENRKKFVNNQRLIIETGYNVEGYIFFSDKQFQEDLNKVSNKYHSTESVLDAAAAADSIAWDENKYPYDDSRTNHENWYAPYNKNGELNICSAMAAGKTVCAEKAVYAGGLVGRLFPTSVMDVQIKSWDVYDEDEKFISGHATPIYIFTKQADGSKDTVATSWGHRYFVKNGQFKHGDKTFKIREGEFAWGGDVPQIGD